MDREAFLALLARLTGEGDPLTAAEFADLAAAIAEMATDDELVAIEDGCRALGDDDDTPLEVVRAAVGLVEAVRAEAGTRIEAAEAEQTERETLRAQLAGEPVDETPPEAAPEGGETPPEETPPVEGETPPEGETAPEDAPEGEPAPAAVEAPPVAVDAAAAPAPRPPSQARPAASALRRRPAGQVDAPARRAHNRIIRDGGGEYADLAEASLSMLRLRESFLSANNGVEEKVPVGSIIAEYPPDRILDDRNAAANQAAFAQLVADLENVTDAGLEAVTAAGGFCAPVTPFYGIPRISTGDRPVRDSLISMQVTRGGITFRRPPDYTTFASASRQWTATNDATPGADGPTTKPVLVVPCLAASTETLYAVTMRLRFGNFMAQADPETVADATDKSLDAHASLAETLLLNKLKSDSTAVDGGAIFGAFSDLLFHWGVTAAGYRSRRRMSPTAVIELRAPTWVRDMIREDISRALNAWQGQHAAADAMLNEALAVRNIRPYWYMDSPTVDGIGTNKRQVFGTQPTGAIVDFPETVQWQMSPPGTFVFMENGSLTFGPVRDSTLIGTNDYETFAEDFEGLARIGYQSIWGTSVVCPNGASAGTTSPDAVCTTGGADYVPTGSGIGAFTAP